MSSKRYSNMTVVLNFGLNEKENRTLLWFCERCFPYISRHKQINYPFPMLTLKDPTKKYQCLTSFHQKKKAAITRFLTTSLTKIGNNLHFFCLCPLAFLILLCPCACSIGDTWLLGGGNGEEPSTDEVKHGGSLISCINLLSKDTVTT